MVASSTVSTSRTDRSCFRVRLVWHQQEYVFTVQALRRSDILALQSIPAQHEIELERAVLRRALVDQPYDQLEPDNQMPAGILSVLAKTVLRLSYAIPDSQQDLLGRVEQWVSTPEGRIELLAILFLHLPIQTLWQSTMLEWAAMARAAAMAAAMAGLSVQDWIERGEWKWNVTETPPVEERMGEQMIAPNVVQEYAFSWRKQP